MGTVGFSLSGSSTQLTFTPIANTNVQVRVFANLLIFAETSATESAINFTNSLGLTAAFTNLMIQALQLEKIKYAI